jgi:hypothetical protein
VPGTTGLMPGGAIRNAIFRRSAASATSGVESSLKATERDCCFTRPKNHGIEKSKIRIPTRPLNPCGGRLTAETAAAFIPKSGHRKTRSGLPRSDAMRWSVIEN